MLTVGAVCETSEGGGVPALARALAFAVAVAHLDLERVVTTYGRDGNSE